MKSKGNPLWHLREVGGTSKGIPLRSKGKSKGNTIWKLREVGWISKGIYKYSLSFINFERQYRPNAITFNKIERP